MTSPYFIAEVSSNHHRDLDRCLQFIDVSADIGCNAVKFQLFRINELFAEEARKVRPELQAREAWELPVEFLPHLEQRCRERNIAFSCTPFYLEAVAELKPFVDFYKIASYELLWSDLLRSCAATGKPVVLSVGMAVVEEIDMALYTLKESGCDNITLLHCISGYPTPVDQCNLAAIATLQQRYPDITVGWSDHSVNSGVVSRAIHRYNASTIEFHLDLDGEGEEFTTGHCWLPQQAKQMILQIRDGFCADGDGIKQPTAAELPDRPWRADPIDGLRPLQATRSTLKNV